MSITTPPAAELFTFGPFRLDVALRELSRDGEPVALTVKAFDTLLVLLRQRHRVVEKDELVRTVWPDTFVSDDSLTHSISVLRRTLGDDSSQPQYIATIPRRGYRFVGTAVVVAARAVEVTDIPAAMASPEQPAAPAPSVLAFRAPRGWWPVWIAVPLAVILLMVGTATMVPRGMPPVGTIRFEQEAPSNHELASGATVSPDGRFLAFVAREQQTGRARLWVRALDSPEPRALPQTDGAFRPFWSPDGQSLAFFADSKLKRVGLNGQPPQTISDVGYRPSGGTWSAAGVILFSDRQSPLYAVPDTGGEKRTVTTRQGTEIAHQAPFFLPDGRHFLYYTAAGKAQDIGTYVGSLDSPERTRLLDASCSAAIYAEPGFLLYVRDGSIMAHRFDADRRRLLGAPQVIAPTHTVAIADVGVAVISASTTGLLTFGGDTAAAHLTWFGRDGRRLSVINSASPMHNPTISPDERFVAADGTGTNMAIWLIDLERGTPTRIADGVLPVWGPGGTGLAFSSRGTNGARELLFRSIVGPSTEESLLLLRTPEMKIGGNWTPDNRRVVYTESDPRTRMDLWTLSTADRTPVPYLRTSFNEMHGQVSPDGRWLAYASDESGNWEVYVQTFPVAGGKQTISVGGGAEPQWRRDGRELFYVAPDGTLMAVSVKSGETIDAGAPKPLFKARISSDIITYRNHYAASADGQRFLIDAADEREPINVVVNWSAALR